MSENPHVTIENKRILENVKIINKEVEKAKKYLQEHSKEVYQINFDPIGYEEGTLKITICFDANNPQLKEAQNKIKEES